MTLLRRINPTDFFIDASRNFYEEIDTFIVSGQNIDVSAAATEDIWGGGGLLDYLTTAETLDIVSTSVNDSDPSGTGARTVLLEMLDVNYDVITEIVSLNGTTPVTTTKTCLRLQKAILLTAGSLETNDGDITFTSTISSKLQSVIKAGDSITKNSHFTIPNKKIGFVLGASFFTHKLSGGQVPVVEFKLLLRLQNGPWLDLFSVFLDAAVSDVIEITQNISTLLPAKSDVRSTASTTTNATIAAIIYSLLLYDE